MVQGDILEGEVAMAATEIWEEAKQAEQRIDHGMRMSTDRSRQINHLAAGPGFGEGQA